MTGPIFDTHAHYSSRAFDADRFALLDSLPDKGVVGVCEQATHSGDAPRVLELAHRYPWVYAAIGIHPHEAKGFVEDDLQRLADWSKEEKVVAIGEIGLDYYYDLSPRETQMTVCEAQMELAWELSLPVAYHIRDAHQDMLDIMKRHRKHLTGGIIHCFSGSWEIAKEYLKLGYFISFAGPVTFKKAPKLQEAAVNVPLDRILIETDSPYLAPEPVRGRRNEPTNVRYVAEKIAALREMPLEAFAQITMQNALNAYSIKE